MMSTAVSPSPLVPDDVASHGNALSASPRHDGHASSTLESVVKSGGVKLQEQEQEQEQEQKDEATGSHLSDDTPDIWYPLSLQRRTIHVFIGIFVALLTSVEAIFIVSESCQGLTTLSSSAALHYTWTYGPTAVMSLTAVLWSCVDYSAKVSTPWIRIRNAKSDIEVQRALLVDYISPFSLVVPIRAIKNRDVLVATTALVSLFLTVMIVFSSSMIRLAPVGVTLPVQLRSRFVDDPSRLGDPGMMPIYNAIIDLHRYQGYIYGGQLVAESAAERLFAAKKGPCPQRP
ncbi:hypothetical protein B0H66DRAFT_620900 [Apodospora peruviana]|uniref:Uncharacterized protein n=1 Tax=Apodospora peruviana TaxID=516989 RepID=A0AAE0IDG3_9PEZI|nr:hypothetical protein B0H66DRAFT_620900 [Apodospora peruviana]